MLRSRTVALALAFAAMVVLLPGSTARAEPAALLTAPQRLAAGGRATVTVRTFDGATHDALGMPLVVALVSPAGDEHTLYAGATGADGQERIEFTVPSLVPGSYSLVARLAGLPESLDASVTLTAAPGLLIETDKPIYKPGQTIQGRVVLVSNDLRPLAGAVELSFHDAKGIRIDRRQLETDAFGAAPFRLDLARELNFGVWKIRARSGDAESVRDVRVEEYTLPRFELTTEFERSWALVDERVAGTVEARYFFGKDVDGEATVVASRYVGEWQEYARVSGPLDGGAFAFELPPVDFVSGTPGNSGQGSITLEVSVTDSTGSTEETTEVLTITEAPVVLSIVPRSETLKPELEAEILVVSETPAGEPLAVEVTTSTVFYAYDGRSIGREEVAITTANGVGVLRFTPPADTGWAELTASARLDGKSTSLTARIGSSFASSGFISLARVDGSGPADPGDTVEYSVLATHPGTVYYEVYAAGRTVLSDATEADSFAFTVTPEMLPAARVVAYKINPDNEVAADASDLTVRLALEVTMHAAFDAETVKPGEPVVVTVDAGTGRRTLLGLSIVDESVLALGRSRLHMSDVFAELERRFLEPVAEVHEGGGEEVPGGRPIGGFAMDDAFGGPLRSRGAADILREAGLVVVVSDNLVLPQGSPFDVFLRGDEAVDFDGLPPVAAPGEAEASGTEPVRVRQFFPETWAWQPALLTDESGQARLELTAPDSITGWRLAVVGTCPDPVAGGAGIGFGEASLTVFQPFFVEPALPYAAVRGEEFPVKVDVFNYLDEEQTVELALSAEGGFEIDGDATRSVKVGPSAATSVHFPIRPTALGEFPLTLTARGQSHADAVLRPLRVIPEGRPVELVLNDVIEAGTSRPLDLAFPPQLVSGSARAYLHVTPSPVAQTMQGVADLLSMPYGCGEQNMIFLAPDIEILKYLRETGELAPEVRATAEYYVNVGYQRQLTYQTDDGGFAAFGGAEGSLWLTAFVLSTFSGAREVRDIDEGVLGRAAAMLIARQNDDGSFRTDDFLIHKEMDGGLENLYAMSAYTANALAEYGGAEAREALQKAAVYLRDGRTALPGINDDPYSLSIAANALLAVDGFEDTAEAIIDRLLELAIHEGVGIHWEPYPVETTGYAAMALLLSRGGAGRPEVGAALDWLSTTRNALGGYGESTQDTVVAIRALFVAARKVRRDVDVTVSVTADGGSELFALAIDASNFDILHQRELPLDAGPLTLAAEGNGSVGYQVVKRFNVPGGLLPPSRDMELNVDYDASHIEVDDLIEVTVTLLYTGEKAETGMVIADIGVPTGFAAEQGDLDRLVEAGTVERVEIAGRKVIFYVDSLVRGEALRFTFAMRSLYPVRAEGPISRAYEYYDADVEAYHQQLELIVPPRSAATFLRGDANEDARVDLSDAVTILNWLFLDGGGGQRGFCRDAADTDDDGAVNITDPIGVLNFLFLGGHPPRPPYPEPGPDPTEDALDCR